MGTSQTNWDTVFTLFSKYGPIPLLLFKYFLTHELDSKGVVEDRKG